MRKITFPIFFIACIFVTTSKAQITATQMGMLDFQVTQSLVANDMNGTNDVTTKLQAAVDSARLANKTLFIPSGTYKVSNTIDCKIDFGGTNGYTMLTPVCIVGSSINRPLIVLANSVSGFSGTNPKCVLKYRSTSTKAPTPDWVMEGGIRSINFDLGTGNTNAVAVSWGCAQYCFIEDISIEARSGFAGFLAIGGANQLLANISVNGGQYGIYLPNASESTTWGLSGQICQSTITGCTFTNQTVNALHLWGYGGITMSGITISQATGTAIFMKGDSWSPLMSFPFSLIDTKITFTTSSSSNLAISNLTRCNVALNGVFVNGAGTVINNNGDENLTALTPITSWTHVARFNYVDKTTRHDGQGANYLGTHYNALGGTFSTAAIVQTDATPPPSDITSRHIWATTPSFEDNGAVLVPAGSSSATIQATINANTEVFLAHGTYSLSSPITLKANSIFCGCPGVGLCGSILTNGFTPSSATWLITTENSAAATTYMMDVCTNTTNVNYMGSVHWMAGANSIFRTNLLDRGYKAKEPNIIRLYFSGNGGGRIFNYQDEKAPGGTMISGFRKVKVSGTSQQLTFYGLDLERGGSLYPVSSWPMLEIANASKVRVFGAKTEAFQPYATINGCTDIFLTNVIDYCANGYGTTGANQIEISGTNDMIECSNMIWDGPPAATPAWKIVLDPWNTIEPTRQQFLGVYHYNWSTISDIDTTYTGINQIDVHKFLLFPNPTTNSLTIELPSFQINEKIQIYDANGRLVKFEDMSSTHQVINIDNLAHGFYFVHLKLQNSSMKFIKQ